MPELIAQSYNIPWDNYYGRYNRRHSFDFIIAPQGAIATGEAGLRRSLQVASSLSPPPFIFLMNVSEEVMERIQEKIRNFPMVSTLDANEVCFVSVVLQSHEYSIENAIQQTSLDSWKYGVQNSDVIGRFVSHLRAQRKYGISSGLCLPDEELEMVHLMQYQMQSRNGPPYPMPDTRWTYTRLLVSSILLCLTIIGCIAGIPMLIHTGMRYSKDKELARAVSCSKKIEIPGNAVDTFANSTASNSNDLSPEGHSLTSSRATGWKVSLRPSAAFFPEPVSGPDPCAIDTLDNPSPAPAVECMGV
jgi:hypothetical protein